MTATLYRERIAGEVRSLMARQRISSAAMSKTTGIATSTLSRKINGASPFTTDELEAVARTLGVQPSSLLPDEDLELHGAAS